MKKEIGRLKKKIQRGFEENFEIDENSDIPIHERYVKDEGVRTLKKKKK